METIKTLILAGGLGTRLREETEFKPKPMIEIGSKPILWHIIKNLSQQGMNHFIIATGYKSDIIKDYFINYETRNNDFTVKIGNQNKITVHKKNNEDNWDITVSYTGEETQTGGRVKLASKYIEKGQRFICTYGDGLANIDIKNLLRFHKEHGKLATVSMIQPTSRFGVMEVDKNNLVKDFKEKPTLDGWINIGYFVFEYEALRFITENSILEGEPLKTLAKTGQLVAFKHTGFWQPMDTYREFNLLSNLWNSNTAPWKNWSSD